MAIIGRWGLKARHKPISGQQVHLAVTIAFNNPRLGVVVVATHSQEWAAGQVVDVTLEQP